MTLTASTGLPGVLTAADAAGADTEAFPVQLENLAVLADEAGGLLA